jgi:hypothetical protein
MEIQINTNEIIQMYLAEGLRLYLQRCFEYNETPNEEVKEYFNKRIKELSGNDIQQ